MGTPQQATPEEFWSRAEVIGDCLVWTWGKDKDGYGKITWDRRHDRAHRVAYRLAHGVIPAGLFVCHTCDNPSCIKPEHLFLGTNADNLRDMSAKRRGRGQDKTACANGHDYDEVNTYWYGNSRGCRKCRKDQWQAWRDRSRAGLAQVRTTR